MSKSKPVAPIAGAPTNTTTKGRGRPRNLLAPRNWPHYSKADRELIQTFLAAMLADVEQAIQQSFETARGSPGGHPAWKTHEYWQNAAGIVRWLYDRADKRQLHLALALVAQQEQAK